MERREVLTRLAQLGAAAAFAPGVRAFQADRRTLPAPKLDAHAHILSRDLVTWMQSASADREMRRAVRPINGRVIVDALEEDAIDRAIVLSSACLHASDVSRGGRKKKPADEYRDVQNEHDFTAAQAAEYAPRLIPFASVNPKRDYAIAEFSRCVDRFRMRGLSVHFGESDVRLRDPQHLKRVQELFGEAARRNLPVIAHIFNGEIEDFGTQDIEILIAKVVAPNPTLRISIAHLGGSGGASEERTLRFFAALIQVVRAHPQVASQVWADCSSVLLTEARLGAKPISAAQKAALGVMLRNWGIDRLMWGTDTLTDRHPTSLEQARVAWPLTDEEWATLAAFDGTGFLPSSGT